MAFSPETALEYLTRANEQQRLAHAYLISGPPGSGKEAVAAGIVAAVNNVPPETALSGRNPDVFVTEPGSRSRRIVIEQIRNLERALQLRSSGSRRKIAVIRDAERMQPQAANAFLKTLEEPPQNSLLLLLTTLPEALPDTIVSRCLPLPLRIPAAKQATAEEKELAEALCAAAGEPAGIARAYGIAQRIQRLLECARQEINEQHATAMKLEEQRYRQTTDGGWLGEREEYYKALTESVYRERRSRLLETVFVWWSDVLRASIGLAGRSLCGCESATAAVAAPLRPMEILKRIRFLEDMREQLNTTANESLVLEVNCLGVFG